MTDFAECKQHCEHYKKCLEDFGGGNEECFRDNFKGIYWSTRRVVSMEHLAWLLSKSRPMRKDIMHLGRCFGEQSMESYKNSEVYNEWKEIKETYGRD